MIAPYLHRYLPYLVDPRTGGDLTAEDGHLIPTDDATYTYPIERGVLKLSAEDLSEVSDALEARYEAEGWGALTEFDFRMLPRVSPLAIASAFWKRRSLSTAAIWGFLEEERHKAGRGVVGLQGVVVELTLGMPYIAYGLDRGSYLAFTVSPNIGRFGMGIHPYSRYCRIQAPLHDVPLKNSRFDTVIYTACLPELDPDAARAALAEGIRLLKVGGHVLITDTPDQDPHIAQLEAAGLTVRTRSVDVYDDDRAQKARAMLSRRNQHAPLIIATRES